MNEDLHELAMLIIRSEIARAEDPPPFALRTRLLLTTRQLEDDNRNFRAHIRAWLEGAVTLSGRDRPYEGAKLWRDVGRPWLQLLVGYYAQTPLGRAAREPGYDALIRFWNALP